MTGEECIRIFDSQGQAYKQAFQIFLDHTDQKRNARRWLQQLVDGLPHREVFIDAGAGNGELARTFAGSFGRTIAIEPNGYLLNQLCQALPAVEAIDRPIMEAQPAVEGDFVLCSHTLYYIPADEWLAHIERLVSWMAPAGVTILVLQHRESGCMNMLHHFYGHRFELRRTIETFRAEHGDRYEITTTLDPAHVETTDLAETYAVAEFMLNLLDIASPPKRCDVEAYVKANFATPDGCFKIPVHQDFVEIRHRAGA
ncbi:MAG: trans-aconitate 2-methyltransferase [Nitrospiraceae bacterium]